MPRIKTAKPNGRPSKKNSQAIARILKVARSGLPLKFAAQAGDNDPETLSQWRAKDPEFARALTEAQLQAVEERWETIRKAAEDRLDSKGNLLKPGDWKALAWQLERKFPSDFGRPEVQLNLAIQQNTVNANGNSRGSFELIVVRDLEYLGLREREGYTHHPDQKPAREIQGFLGVFGPETPRLPERVTRGGR